MPAPTDACLGACLDRARCLRGLAAPCLRAPPRRPRRDRRDAAGRGLVATLRATQHVRAPEPRTRALNGASINLAWASLRRRRTPSLGVAAPGRVRAVRPFPGQCAISGPRHRCASASRCAIEMPRRQPAEMLAAPLQQLPALRRQQKCWHTVMYWALSKENRRSTLLDQRKNLIKVSGFNAISEAPGGDRRLSG